MLIVLSVLVQEGLPVGKDASMSDLTVTTGSLATGTAAQRELVNAAAGLLGELAERRLPRG